MKYRAVAMMSLLAVICVLEGAEAARLQHLLERVGIPRGSVSISETGARYELCEDPLVCPQRQASSLEQALENRAEFLSLGQSSIALLDDILTSLQQEMETLQPLKRIFLQRRVASRTARALKFSKSQEETLSGFRERHGIPLSIIDEQMIGIIERNISTTKSKVEQMRADNVLEIQRMEEFLQGPPSDAQWVSIFKYLVSGRIVLQYKLVLTPDSSFSQDLKRLSFSDRTKVIVRKELFAILDRRISLVYHCLPAESLGELAPVLQIPSLRMYINGYLQDPAEPSRFVSMVTSEDVPCCLVPEPFAPDVQQKLDLEYLGTHRIVELMPDFAVAAKLLDGLGQHSIPPKVAKRKQKNKAHKTGSEEEAIANEPLALVPEAPTATVGTQENAALSSEIDFPAAVVPEKYQELIVPLDIAEEHHKPRRYVPSTSGGHLRTSRIAAMAEEYTNGRALVDCLSYKMFPIVPIKLKGNAADAYIKFYGISHSSAPFEFSDLLTLMSGFRGTASVDEEEKRAQGIGKGNGSLHVLTMPVIAEKIIGRTAKRAKVISRRTIHKPHPGEFFGMEALKLLRRHFSGWGLDPSQGNVQWE